jgi:hypothetical protein
LCNPPFPSIFGYADNNSLKEGDFGGKFSIPPKPPKMREEKGKMKFFLSPPSPC